MATERLAFVLLLLLAAPASAQQVEQSALRLSYVHQEGRGLQSMAEPDERGRGDEYMWLVQPMAYLRLRTGDVVHDVTAAVDVVTAASPDALDAISSASRVNEAGTLDITSSLEASEDDLVSLRWGGHWEEHFWTAFGGLAYRRELADDNATLSANAHVIVDVTDPIDHFGLYARWDERVTLSVNLGFTQVLSPTTWLGLRYGTTAQWGRLDNTWNTVPSTVDERVVDELPSFRHRHALAGELRQILPETGTVGTGVYRFYVDDFGALAHTVDLSVAQPLGDARVRLGYRVHTQSSPSFWTERFTGPQTSPRYRTGDSDLEALDAHELRLDLRWTYERAGARTARDGWLGVGYVLYWRTNGLWLQAVSLDWSTAW